MSEEFVYVAKLDDSQILKSLQNIKSEAEGLGDSIDKALKNASEKKIIADQEKKKIEDAEKAAKKFEATLKALIASELRAAAGSDKVTQSFINQAAAGAQNATALVQAVSQTSRLSQAQIDFATKAGITKAKIRALSEALSAEDADVEALQAEINRLISSLNKTDDAQEAAAAAAQKATDDYRKLASEITKVKERSDAAAKSSKAQGAASQAGGQMSTVAMAAAAGGAAALAAAIVAATKAIIDMGKKAATVIAKIAKDAVQVSAGFSAIETSFINIFQGGEQAAAAAFKMMKQGSREVGIDLSQLYRRFLPLVESLEQAQQLSEIAASLAVLEPEQGIQGALLSLQDLLVGEGTSLRKRYELPTQEIFELQDALGDVEGTIVGLDKILSERGVSFRQLADEAQITFNRMAVELIHFKDLLGQPITDEVNKQFNKFLAFVEENREELSLLAMSLGDVLAAVLEVGGAIAEDLFEEWDIEQTRQDIANLASTIQILGAALSALEGRDVGEEPLTIGKRLASFGFDISEEKQNANAIEALLGGIQIQAKLAVVAIEWVRAAFQTLSIEAQAYADIWEAVTSGRLSDVGRIAQEARDLQRQVLEQAPIEAGRRIKEMDDIIAQNTKTLEERQEALTSETEAGEAAANAILSRVAAEKALEEAQKKLREETEKVNKEIETLEQDTLTRRMQMQIDYARDVIDINRKAGEDRIDAYRDFISELNKLRRKNEQDIIDSGTKRDRDIEDARIKAENQQIDAEKARAKKKLDIEEDFQRRLAEIRRKFDFDAEEAIRANDAVALVRIRRRMEFELNEARIKRDERLADEDAAIQEEQDKQDTNLQRSIDAAKLAHERRLEDLKLALARDKNERFIAFKEELAEIKTNTVRKLAEAKLAWDREREDLKRHLDIKRALLQESLNDEIIAVQEAEAAKMMIRVQAFADTIAQQIQFARMMVSIPGIGVTTSGIPGVSNVPGGGGGRPRRRDGGPVTAGQPTIVGEPLPGGRPNPELFVPGADGYIFPLRDFMYSPMQADQSGGGTVDNSKHLSAQMSFPDPNGLSPLQKAEVVALATSVLAEALI